MCTAHDYTFCSTLQAAAAVHTQIYRTMSADQSARTHRSALMTQANVQDKMLAYGLTLNLADHCQHQLHCTGAPQPYAQTDTTHDIASSTGDYQDTQLPRKHNKALIHKELFAALRDHWLRSSVDSKHSA